MVQVLQRAGIEPVIRNTDHDDAVANEVRALGYQSVPVTTYRDLVLKGYDPRDLAGLIERFREHGR